MNKLTKSFSALLVAGGVVAGVIVASSGGASSAASADTAALAQPVQQRNTNLPTRHTVTTTKSSTKSAPPIDESQQSSKDVTGTVDSKMMHRPGQAVAGTDTGQWSSMLDYMTFVLRDSQLVWNWYYQQWGRSATSVNYNFSSPGQVIYSACGGAPLTDTSSPFYCPTDDTIYFSQVRAQWYWNNAGGDFAVATAIAHEFGHNVQNELGFDRNRYTSMQYEQDADCFSGAFAHVAYYQNILDANDINEAKASRSLVGDDGTGPDAHGTPQARINAFMLGYNSAGPSGCDAILPG